MKRRPLSNVEKADMASRINYNSLFIPKDGNKHFIKSYRSYLSKKALLTTRYKVLTYDEYFIRYRNGVLHRIWMANFYIQHRFKATVLSDSEREVLKEIDDLFQKLTNKETFNKNTNLLKLKL